MKKSDDVIIIPNEDIRDQPESDASQQDLPHWSYSKQQDERKTEEEPEATGRPGSRGSPGGFV